MKITLNRQVFLALATIAWADGHLDQSEREGILRSARSSGWTDDSVASLDEALKSPVALDSLDVRKLSALDRVFVYATGEWLARIDGHLDPKEEVALKALGTFLMLSPAVQERARTAALEVAALPSGNRPDKYDLVKLRQVLQLRMQR
jgi:uncharacterized membrane protein YebE (DUF533 family)